ncbi:NAD(P)-dependent glycerol-3-phosphate dehydrogenase [Pseudorhodobacter turbinis]|uniref:Glycerol-3-phosphate dehydrogenase [NAD(P)+] n=1 Tax=Pseudorhodobacter turbinis TaxID=2500533 RepID=A0A4P8EGK8_9RHOB|nr:NAD(P)H-dependent glycerol-3-phosphate dehydrogenase [Pseudorhodobacter turbinis]QCO55853.1 NAD(P)-dependent glycerol-3-phosphate dehydrogenase [Pseudorhodobacter turbinis]
MIGIIGAGAFGGALAITLGAQSPVMLWGRGQKGRGIDRLPGAELPALVTVADDLAQVMQARTVLLALPAQAMGRFLAEHAGALAGRNLVACCKGVDLTTGLGPTGVILTHCPDAHAAILTGPSFASDIAKGLPTALTLACADDAVGMALQHQLSTDVLRLYRTTDVIGAEFGGALKNVIAIAAGVVIGAGLGESARAALMTRGFAEMQRLALHQGARVETLGGLSGFGDLVLTCTSAQSRNFRFGVALGEGASFDPAMTVEGVATAQAVAKLAQTHGVDMPVTQMVAALSQNQITLEDAVRALMSRPLKPE